MTTIRLRRGVILQAVVLGVLLGRHAASESAPQLLLSRVGACVIPLFETDAGKRIATVYATDLRKTYQRKGFFRIGALPCWRIESARVQLEDEVASRWLGERLLGFADGSKLPIEIGTFSIWITGEDQPRMKVGECRQLGPDHWRLSETSLCAPGQGCRTYPSLDLRLGGNAPGWILQHPSGTCVEWEITSVHTSTTNHPPSNP